MDKEKIEQFLGNYSKLPTEKVELIVQERGNYQVEASYAALKTLINNGVENKSEYEDILKNEYECEAKWFYNFNGSRKGPVLPIEIRKLIADGNLDTNSQVWSKDVNGWVPLYQTELAEMAGENIAPPALEGDAVKSTFVWILAFAPVLGTIVEYMLFDHRTVWFMWAFNSLFAFLDSRQLKQAGHNVNKWVWSIFLVPVYLWIRQEKTKQSKAPFWVWMILIFIYIWLLNAAYELAGLTT